MAILPNKIYKYVEPTGIPHYSILTGMTPGGGYTEITKEQALAEIPQAIQEWNSKIVPQGQGAMSGQLQFPDAAKGLQQSLSDIQNMPQDSGYVDKFTDPRTGEVMTNVPQTTIDKILSGNGGITPDAFKAQNAQQAAGPQQPTGPQPNPTVAVNPNPGQQFTPQNNGVVQTTPQATSRVYKIQPGDTLSALAAKNGTTVQALMAANPQIKDPNLIIEGQNLNIPTSGQNNAGGVNGAINGGNNGSSGVNTGTGTGGTAPTAPNPPAPKDFITQYTDTMTQLGLPTIKQSYEKAVKDYADLQNELNDKISEVSKNPWLSEGLRSKEITSLQNKYQGKLDILTNQQKLFDALYQEGVAQAQFLTTGEVKQATDLAKIAQDKADALAKLNSSIVESDGHKWLVTYTDTGMVKSKTDLGATTNGTTNQTTLNKTLDILDVQRYNDLYPDAGITAGDTYASANAKVAGLKAPKDYSEEDLTTLANQAKTGKVSYQDAITEIDNDLTVKNKDLAKQVFAKVYGVKVEPLVYGQGNFKTISINDRIYQLKSMGGAIAEIPSIKTQLLRDGYSQVDIIKATANVGEQILDSISNFLFGKK